MDASYLRLHAETRGFQLGRPVRPKPTADGKFVLFLRAKARTPTMSLFEFDTATGKTRELLTPEQLLKGAEEHLSPEEKARRERQRVSVGGFTDFQLSPDGNQILVTLSGKLYWWIVRRVRPTSCRPAMASSSIRNFRRTAVGSPTFATTTFTWWTLRTSAKRP